jgi:hypothetical protein
VCRHSWIGAQGDQQRHGAAAVRSSGLPPPPRARRRCQAPEAPLLPIRGTRPTAEAPAGTAHQPRATVRWLAAARKAPEKHRDLEGCRARLVDRGFAGRHRGRDVYRLGAAGFRSDPDRPVQRDVPVRPPQLASDGFLPPATVAVGAKRPRAAERRMPVETADARVASFAVRVQPRDGKTKFTPSAGSPTINAKVDPSFTGGKHSDRMGAIGISLLGS